MTSTLRRVAGPTPAFVVGGARFAQALRRHAGAVEANEPESAGRRAARLSGRKERRVRAHAASAISAAPTLDSRFALFSNCDGGRADSSIAKSLALGALAL